MPAGQAAATAVLPTLTYLPEVPTSARPAIQQAVGEIGAALQLDPNGPVEILVAWRSLGAGMLAVAGATGSVVDFPGLPAGEYGYPLANTLLGRDLTSDPEIIVIFDSSVPWNLDANRAPTSFQYDLYDTALHELSHGFGFLSQVDPDGYYPYFELTMAYDRHITRNSTPLTSLHWTDQDASLTSNDLWIDVGGGRSWKLFAPPSFLGGSSTHHFDENAYPWLTAGSLMTPYGGAGEYHTGLDAPTLGVLRSVGWPMQVGPVAASSVRATVENGTTRARWDADLLQDGLIPDTWRVELLSGGTVLATRSVPGGTTAAQLAAPPAGAADLAVRVTPILDGLAGNGADGGVAFGAATSRPLEDQVVRLYSAYFGRAPDTGGLDFWMRQRVLGRTVDSVSEEFARSPEFARLYGSLSDADFIDLVYANVMNRAADPGGRAFWLGQMAAGVPRGRVMTEFSESSEYIGRTATVAPTSSAIGQVSRLYEAYFDRLPDAGGLDFWVGRLSSGWSIAQVSESFAQSPEFAALYGTVNDDDFLDLVYANVLGRAPDAGGRASWLAQMNAGLGRGAVMTAFSNSTENVLRAGSMP